MTKHQAPLWQKKGKTPMKNTDYNITTDMIQAAFTDMETQIKGMDIADVHRFLKAYHLGKPWKKSARVQGVDEEMILVLAYRLMCQADDYHKYQANSLLLALVYEASLIAVNLLQKYQADEQEMTV
ncbi:hypothetical protein LJC55_03480 [Eubacteriales bacterium OttesenSCG-928-N14]|nr:hypothetical protein [Eubacteriales bacterium OttesenSCG-928-N14]